MNSGFGPGAPRDDNYRGVQEGREEGGYLPRIRGVGRIGKPAIPIPAAMVAAFAAARSEASKQYHLNASESLKQLRQVLLKMRTDLDTSPDSKEKVDNRHSIRQDVVRLLVEVNDYELLYDTETKIYLTRKEVLDRFQESHSLDEHVIPVEEDAIDFVGQRSANKRGRIIVLVVVKEYDWPARVAEKTFHPTLQAQYLANLDRERLVAKYWKAVPAFCEAIEVLRVRIAAFKEQV